MYQRDISKIRGKSESTLSCKVICSKMRTFWAEAEVLRVIQCCQMRGTACKPMVRENLKCVYFTLV